MTATLDEMVALPCTTNEVTGRPYQGGNVGRLLEATISNGYNPDRGWAGFTQWRTIGRTVRKDEHGTPCRTVVTVDRDAEGNGGTRKPRGFKVFHYDQTAELVEAPTTTDALRELHDAREAADVVAREFPPAETDGAPSAAAVVELMKWARS